jgi:hypothetical protein
MKLYVTCQVALRLSFVDVHCDQLPLLAVLLLLLLCCAVLLLLLVVPVVCTPAAANSCVNTSSKHVLSSACVAHCSLYQQH